MKYLALLVTLLLLFSCTQSSAPTEHTVVAPVVKDIKDVFHTQGGASYPDSLAPVFPNPYNALVGDTSIFIHFTVADTSGVILLIQNPLGDSVAIFKNATLPPGEQDGSWQPVNSAGNRLRPGLYFITLRINGISSGTSYINSELLSIQAD